MYPKCDAKSMPEVPDGPDLTDAWEEYVGGLAGEFARKTVIHKTCHTRQFVRWASDREVNGYKQPLSLGDLKLSHIRRYLAYRQEQGMTETTRYHDGTQIRQFLDYCRRMGYIDRDPTAGLKLKKTPQRPIEVPTDQEVSALLQWTKDRWDLKKNRRCRYTSPEERTFYARRDHSLFLLLSETGCRVGEAVHLALSNIFLQERVLTEEDWCTIRKMKLPDAKRQDVGGCVRFVDTKTRIDRRVPVSTLWLKSAAEWLIVKPRGSDSDLLFTTSFGRKICEENVAVVMKHYCSVAGIRPLTPQWLRKYRLTKLANANLLVASELGGNSVGVLRKHYVKVDEDVARKVWMNSLNNRENPEEGKIAQKRRRLL